MSSIWKQNDNQINIAKYICDGKQIEPLNFLGTSNIEQVV